MSTSKHYRGFTLLIAIILSTVALTVGLSLLDVAYKQALLASSSKESVVAFYSADTALECALYYDQKLNAFDYTSPLAAGSIFCGGLGIVNYSSTQAGGIRKTEFSSNNNLSSTTIYKTNESVDCYGAAPTGTSVFNCIYTRGYNSASFTNPRRIERGLKASY